MFALVIDQISLAVIPPKHNKKAIVELVAGMKNISFQRPGMVGLDGDSDIDNILVVLLLL